MKLILCAIMVVSLLAGCKPAVEFVGEEYPSTDHVDLYCSWQDVENDHRVIGHFVPADEDMANIPRMRLQMLKAARKKGADALVIIGAGPCTDDTEPQDLFGSSALRAHQVKVSLLRYRVAEDSPVGAVESSEPTSPDESN